jgi:uncharacterized membrane protein YadS
MLQLVSVVLRQLQTVLTQRSGVRLLSSRNSFRILNASASYGCMTLACKGAVQVLHATQALGAGNGLKGTIMKIAGGLLIGMAAGLLALRAVRSNGRDSAYVPALAGAFAIAGALFAISFLMPDGLEQATQELIGWCLAGSVAALGLLASVKGLEGLLDS